MCKDCNSPKLFRYTVCKKCFYEKYCAFCQELTLKADCKGHFINTPTTNRFMEDKQFTNELMFELEK